MKKTPEQIWEEFQSNLPDKQLMLDLLGRKLLLMLRRKASEPKRSPKDLVFAKRYIEENFHSKITFSALAEKCGLGYDYFNAGESSGEVAEIVKRELSSFMSEHFPNIAEKYDIRVCRMPWRRMFEVDLALVEKNEK